MPDELRFFAPGIARPGGSKKAFRSFSTGRPMLKEACKFTAEWRATVALAGNEAMIGRPLFEGPLAVRFDFCRGRPKGHYRKNGTLKPKAPQYPTSAPDCTKTVRSTEDALKGIAWRDDAQIVMQLATKVYAEPIGCWVTVEQMGATSLQEMAIWEDPRNALPRRFLR